MRVIISDWNWMSATPNSIRFERSIQGRIFLFFILLTSLSAANVRGRSSDAVFQSVLDAPIITIADKTKPSPTGDNRDYVSYARYWWPDPAKPEGLPFIRKDGRHNDEQVAAGDRKKIDLLVNHVDSLTQKWTVFRREDAARRAGDWIRAWFVTPESRMNPQLNYAQIRLGHDKNLGSAAGVLDTRRFAELVEVLPQLQDSPALSPAEWTTVRHWFEDYFHWLETGASARGERQAMNNHGSWYFVQTVAIARYLGREDKARSLCEEARSRIDRQFAPDGSQPLEIVREDGLSYSVFNLEAQFQLVVIARTVGVELWHYTAPAGGSLKKGLEYLQAYNDAPENWPHKQHATIRPGFLNELLGQAARWN